MSTMNVNTIANAAGTGAPDFPFGLTYSGNLVGTNVRGSEGSGTTTLTISDDPVQVFNLSAARTVVLPTTGVVAGAEYIMVNRGDFLLTVQASSGTEISIANSANNNASIAIGYVKLRALQNAPTAATHWLVEDVYDNGSGSGSLTTTSGGATYTNTYILSVRRQNYLVVGYIHAASAPSALIGTVTTITTSAGAIPVRFRTTLTEQRLASAVINNGMGRTGFFVLPSDGGVNINMFDESAFTGDSRPLHSTFSYIVA